jgi:hypothetical protein
MHTDDPERNKREELKKQIINKYIGNTLIK